MFCVPSSCPRSSCNIKHKPLVMFFLNDSTLKFKYNKSVGSIETVVWLISFESDPD